MTSNPSEFGRVVVVEEGEREGKGCVCRCGWCVYEGEHSVWVWEWDGVEWCVCRCGWGVNEGEHKVWVWEWDGVVGWWDEAGGSCVVLFPSDPRSPSDPEP